MRRYLLVAAIVAVLASTMTLVQTRTTPDSAVAAAQQAARCPRGLVALTFDDGPDPARTRKILNVLIHKGVPATFFMVGERVPGHARLLRKMHRHGYRFGNHTYRHENLTALSGRQIRQTLRRTTRVIRRVGSHRPLLIRPPYGAINDRVRRIVRAQNMTPVLWNVDSRDWDGRSARKITATVVSQLDRGTNIVLLHDGVANSARTLAALPTLIKRIRGDGYCLAKLDRRGRPVR